MPYVNPWNPNVPLGSADSGTIDDNFRLLRAQIEERMNTILDPTGLWAADPIKLAAAVTLKTGLKLFLGPFFLRVTTASIGLDADLKYMQVSGGNNNGYISLPLQSNWKVTKIEALVDPFGASVTFATKKTTFTSSPASTSISTGSFGGGPLVAVVSIFTGSETVGDAYYSIDFDSDGTWNFYGVRVTYNEV